MKQKPIYKQIGKPITITNKNVGPLLRQAIKAFKKMEKDILKNGYTGYFEIFNDRKPINIVYDKKTRQRPLGRSS